MEGRIGDGAGWEPNGVRAILPEPAEEGAGRRLLDDRDEDQGEPDGRDQCRDRWRIPATQRPQREEFDKQAEQSANQYRDHRGRQEWHPVQRDQRVGDDRAQHEDGAVREVQDIENAEYQRVADGEQRIDRPDKDRVEELLRQAAS